MYAYTVNRHKFTTRTQPRSHFVMLHAAGLGEQRVTEQTPKTPLSWRSTTGDDSILSARCHVYEQIDA